MGWSNWNLSDGKFTSDVTIPIDTTATIYLPTKDSASATANGAPLRESEGVSILPDQNNSIAIQVVSGIYHFEAKSN